MEEQREGKKRQRDFDRVDVKIYLRNIIFSADKSM
jgi:hypothetical protein